MKRYIALPAFLVAVCSSLLPAAAAKGDAIPCASSSLDMIHVETSGRETRGTHLPSETAEEEILSLLDVHDQLSQMSCARFTCKPFVEGGCAPYAYVSPADIQYGPWKWVSGGTVAYEVREWSFDGRVYFACSSCAGESFSSH